MMHVDKNADGHVVEQNVDRISKEIAYVPLSGRIRPKRSSCMQPFFFFFVLFLFLFFLIEKNEYKTCLPVVRTKWGFQSWSWILNVLPRGPRIWILDVLRRGPIDLKFRRASQRSKDWNFGRASQRSIEIEFWTYFLEVQGFDVWTCFLEVRNLDVLPRGPRIGILDMLPRGPLKLNFRRTFQRSKDLKFGRASQRSDGFVKGDICANVYGSFTIVPAK